MMELIRTNDAVFLSWLQAALAEAGIESVLFDQYTSAIEGSIGALPRRVMVHDADIDRARWVINASNTGGGS